MDEARYRHAEERLWEWIGEKPIEHRVPLGPWGVSVRIQEVGTGPPVLFASGVNTCGTVFARLAAKLTGFRCLLLDRPGTGLSEPLAGRLEPAALADLGDRLLVAVLDALGLPQADLAATSYGGYFALRAAAARPERFGRMVQYSWPVGAGVHTLPAMFRMGAVPGIRALMSRMPVGRGAAKLMFRQLGHAESVRDGRIASQDLDAFLALLRHTDTRRNEMTTGRGFFSMRGFLDGVRLGDDLLGAITTPTLFLWGERDPLGDESVARRIVEAMPNARLEMVPKAGHAPWLDDLDGAVKATRAFLSAG